MQREASHRLARWLGMVWAWGWCGLGDGVGTNGAVAALKWTRLGVGGGGRQGHATRARRNKATHAAAAVGRRELTSGRLPTEPSTWPTKRSARVSVGSIMVPTPMSPPGTAYCRSFDSAKRERMREKSGTHFIAPSLPREMMPAGAG